MRAMGNAVEVKFERWRGIIGEEFIRTHLWLALNENVEHMLILRRCTSLSRHPYLHAVMTIADARKCGIGDEV